MYHSMEEGKDTKRWRRKTLVALSLILSAFLILLGRLWQLQILEGQRFSRLSDENRIRLIPVPFTRGIIYDRDGRILADNRPTFNLMAIAAEIDDPHRITSTLRRGVSFSGDHIASAIIRAKKRHPFRPIRLRRSLSWEEMAWVKTHQLDLQGVWVEAEPVRFYPNGPVAAHVLGYVGEITEELLRRWGKRGYRVGDQVGKAGVESAMEPWLKGRHGGLQVEVDAQGRQLMVLNEVSFEPGANVYLTLDLRLQQVAERALGERDGAVVAGDPSTGEIFALVSHPSFDPNLFSWGLTKSQWRRIQRDPRHPLQNRAISAQYPPGSTFKIVTALAGLQEGIISPKSRFFCPGYYHLGDRTFRCWREAGHGWLNVTQALVQSCDVFFYQLGLKLGPERLAKHARSMGLGRPTGLELPFERGGVVPSAKWKRRNLSRPWLLGETLSFAIGQGYTLVTPMQQFVLISAVANGGKVLVPQLIQRVQKRNGKVVKEFNKKVRAVLDVHEETIALLQEAIRQAVMSPMGTGKRARIPGIEVAGKTGTAQVVGIREDIDEESLPYELRDHAWFLGYAPAGRPKIAVVVLVEHGGKGGKVAAPIARRIMEAYLRSSPKGEENVVAFGPKALKSGLDAGGGYAVAWGNRGR